MTQRLRPAILDPVVLLFPRSQVEACDVAKTLRFLGDLTASPPRAHEFRGRVSLVFDGYNEDPREIFEVPEIRNFVRRLDDKWSYWYFFLSQADESIKMLEGCLCETVEVIPGVASIDTQQLEGSIARHLTAMMRLCEALNVPEAEAEALAEGIVSLFRNASVERIEGDEYQ